MKLIINVNVQFIVLSTQNNILFMAYSKKCFSYFTFIPVRFYAVEFIELLFFETTERLYVCCSLTDLRFNLKLHWRDEGGTIMFLAWLVAVDVHTFVKERTPVHKMKKDFQDEKIAHFIFIAENSNLKKQNVFSSQVENHIFFVRNIS